MTTAAADGPAGHPSIAHRAGMWLGHLHPRIAPPLFAVMLLGPVVAMWLPGLAAHAVISYAATPATITLILAGLCSSHVHDRNLCERDFDDTLLDPQGAVERHDRQLRWFHRHFKATTVALFAGFILVATWDVLSSWPWPARAAVTLTALALVTVVCYGLTSMGTHRRLKRWCRYCRRNGGGDPAPAPTPDPVTTGRRHG